MPWDMERLTQREMRALRDDITLREFEARKQKRLRGMHG